MTTDNQNSPAKKAEESLINKLTGGEYVDNAEAAELLGLGSVATLRALRSEQARGGRKFKQKGKEVEVPLSARAAMLPEPEGELKSTVWKKAALEAIAEEFKAAQVVRTPRKK